MASHTEIDQRSEELEKIRCELRRHLDISERNKKRSQFSIQYDAKIALTKGEELMMRKQIVAYRHTIFSVNVSFSSKRNRRGPSTTRITVSAERRRVPLKI